MQELQDSIAEAKKRRSSGKAGAREAEFFLKLPALDWKEYVRRDCIGKLEPYSAEEVKTDG